MFTLTHTLSLIHSLARTCGRARALSLSSLSLSLFLASILIYTRTRAHTHTLSLSLSLFRITGLWMLTLTYTHTHTHTLYLSISLSLSLDFSVSTGPQAVGTNRPTRQSQNTSNYYGIYVGQQRRPYPHCHRSSTQHQTECGFSGASYRVFGHTFFRRTPASS